MVTPQREFNYVRVLIPHCYMLMPVMLDARNITWSLMSFLALLPSSPSLSPASTVSSIDAATDASPFFLDLDNECGFFEIR